MTVSVLATRPDRAGQWRFDDEREAAALTAAVAGRIPTSPPAEWFNKSHVAEGGPLTFTEDGRVYGLLAPSNVAHIGFPGRNRRAPKSASGYSYFHTGQVRCDDGSLVSTGRITMLTGHESDPYADAQTAAAHYDQTGSAVADVVAWDTPSGVMCAGAARPGLTGEQIRMAMASPPSGDWRPVNGRDLELVGALLVNVAGFPTAREALAASGELASLVASGWAPPTITIRTTTEEPAVPDTDEATTAAADAPSNPKRDLSLAPDQVVLLPSSLPPGLIASIDGDRAVVSVEVPLAELADAGPEGRMALSASARERHMEARLSKALSTIDEMQSRMESMVASAEMKQRGAEALNELSDIPDAS